MDELRCEGPCVGRIGPIWEVVLFLAVSGCLGVSSGSPFSGCLGESAAPFHLRQSCGCWATQTSRDCKEEQNDIVKR